MYIRPYAVYNGEYVLSSEVILADYLYMKNLKGIETIGDWVYEFNFVDISFEEFYIN